jgi:hypothetical protein
MDIPGFTPFVSDTVRRRKVNKKNEEKAVPGGNGYGLIFSAGCPGGAGMALASAKPARGRMGGTRRGFCVPAGKNIMLWRHI